jgi:DNA-directed RNA polymerase specialized sigma24 family protein
MRSRAAGEVFDVSTPQAQKTRWFPTLAHSICLISLPPHQRALVSRVYLRGHDTHAELAVGFGISVGTDYSRLHHRGEQFAR